ncbi:hypothetical protein Dimus_003650, partial [Dionaea muscipula]
MAGKKGQTIRHGRQTTKYSPTLEGGGVASGEFCELIPCIARTAVTVGVDGIFMELGLCLRDICAANRSDEKQQIKALLESVGNSFCPDNVDWFGRDGGDVLMSTLGMLIDLFSQNSYMLILLIAQRQNC